jgi:hypothetical protein
LYATNAGPARALHAVGADHLSTHLDGTAPLEVSTGPRVLWLALRYSVGSRSARAAAWRRLQKVQAINIEPGLWGVRAGPAEAEQFDAVAALIEDAGGHARVDEIGLQPGVEVALTSRLERACERLWDEFFNAAEWYAATHELRSGDDDAPTVAHDRVEDLAGLFAMFGTLATRDVVQSQAMERAEWAVLRDTRDLLTSLGPDAPAPSAPPLGRGPRVRLAARGLCGDGSATYVALVRPGIDPLWEAAFAAFEERTFVPDPTRPALRAGSFRWVGDPAGEAEVLRGLDRRVRLFESSLA